MQKLGKILPFSCIDLNCRQSPIPHDYRGNSRHLKSSTSLAESKKFLGCSNIRHFGSLTGDTSK